MNNKMKWVVSGDCHGNVTERLDNIAAAGYVPRETNVILLGDVGLNFWLNKSDINNKKRTNARGFNIWCIHGNHETRASDIPTIQWAYDEQVDGIVGTESEFPNIHYFKDDVNEYTIDGYKCLIIPGAFSVDGKYRRQRVLGNSWCGWWENEQLTKEEMAAGLALATGKSYDFVFSHTCPISIEPRDLFLSMVRQEDVDKTMENYLETIIKVTSFKLLCFGHYHDDRLERPWAQMFYYSYEALDDIYERIVHPRNEPDYYHKKSPNYYMEDN